LTIEWYPVSDSSNETSDAPLRRSESAGSKRKLNDPELYLLGSHPNIYLRKVLPVYYWIHLYLLRMPLFLPQHP
jgi:hypothetical protein